MIKLKVMKRYFLLSVYTGDKRSTFAMEVDDFLSYRKIKKEIGERYGISDPEIFVNFCNEITEEDYKNWYS